MREFYSLRDVGYQYNWSLAKIVDLLVYVDHTLAYLYLSNNDNEQILKPGFIPLPKQMFEELATRLNDRNQDFGSLTLEIFHTLNPMKIGRHYVYDHVVNNKALDNEISNVEQYPFYKLTTIKSVQHPEGFDANLPNGHAISLKNISPDNIFVMADSVIIDEICRWSESLDSYEIQLINRMRSEIFKQQDLLKKDYEKVAEEWLQKVHPLIPRDAIERIILVAKPNNFRGAKWWENNRK